MFRGDASAVNCYSTHGQCTAITQDDAVSGKLTYMLNGGLVADAVWYQTLTDDNHPVFDNTHGMVYKAGDEYGDIHDDASLAAFKEKMVAEGRAYIQELVATTDLITEYEEELNIFEGLTSIDDVLVELPEHERLRKELEASAAAYAAFKAKVEETIAYLEENTDFEGENRDELSDFLLSGDEPNDVYPNGGADYIYNTHELYTDDVKAEIASIDQMLADAINEENNGAYHYVYDRSSVRQKRDPKEIGISSVRGGSIVGDHEVLFCGPDEVITLRHTAYSRSIFANGAVNAAVYLAKKEPGLYDMGDLIAAL